MIETARGDGNRLIDRANASPPGDFMISGAGRRPFPFSFSLAHEGMERREAPRARRCGPPGGLARSARCAVGKTAHAPQFARGQAPPGAPPRRANAGPRSSRQGHVASGSSLGRSSGRRQSRMLVHDMFSSASVKRKCRDHEKCLPQFENQRLDAVGVSRPVVKRAWPA